MCRCFCLPARVCTSGVSLECCWGDVCLIFGIREGEEKEECSYAVLCWLDICTAGRLSTTGWRCFRGRKWLAVVWIRLCLCLCLCLVVIALLDGSFGRTGYN